MTFVYAMTRSQMDMIRSTDTDEKLDYCPLHEQRWIFRVKLTADVYQYWILYSWNFGSFSVEREKCTTSVTSGAGTAYPSGTSEFITLSLCPIFCWPLMYYLFFCVRLIITPLISSSFSFIVVYCASTYSNYTILWFTIKLCLNA